MRLIRFLINLAVLGALGAIVWIFYQDQTRTVASQALQQVMPCTRPVTYRIGAIDPRFGITKEQVVADVAAAAKIWNQGSAMNLFSYDPEHGTVVIDFIYDSRQAATQQLKKIGVEVSDDRATYDAVKAKYASVFDEYKRRKATFEASLASFQVRQAAYNQEVSDWNRRGGAPADAYDRLQREKSALAAESSRLKAEESAINELVADVNALASELNHLIDALNLDVAKYNETGASNGAEFEEAVYVRALGNEDIHVYEFDSNARLIRVLAHELGHAIGLEHVDDAKAIMYKLNQSTNQRLTDSDMKAVKAICRVP